MASDVAEQAGLEELDERSGPFAMAVRWLCLLVVLAATFLSLSAVFPQHDPFARALYDFQHHNSSVVYIEKLDPNMENGPIRVIWQTDRLSWHQADVPVIPSPPCDVQLMYEPMHISDGGLAVTVDRGGQCWRTTFDEARALTALASSGNGSTFIEMNLDQRIIERRRFLGFPVGAATVSFNALAIHGRWAVPVGVIWLGAFLGVMFRGGHPYATRWAWFWLFVIGGAGAPLLLWKEPEPLRLRFWRRPTEPHVWRRPPIRGVTGLLYAITLTVALLAVGRILGWAANQL